MSQAIWGTINPATTSGNQLAAYLNNFKDAMVSGLSGVTRPSELKEAGSWIDLTNDAAGTWDYKIFDGVSTDITVFTINKSTGKVIFSGSEGSFDISKISDDVAGPVLNLLKSRIADNGQTKTGDTLGQIVVKGSTDGGVDVVQAVVEIVADDDTTTTTQGTRVAFRSIAKGSATLSEVMTHRSGMVGIKNSNPQAELDVIGEVRATNLSEDAIGPEINIVKKRLNNNGQALDGDAIGSHNFIGLDATGAEITLASIEITADDNIATGASGSVLSIKAIAKGTDTLSEVIRVEDNVVSIMGVAQDNDSNLEQTLLGVNTPLFTLDSAKYKAFRASISVTSFDSVEGYMAQTIEVRGVYDIDANLWRVTDDSTVLLGPNRSIELAYAGLSDILAVSYDNVMANFSSGKVYTQIRRQ